MISQQITPSYVPAARRLSHVRATGCALLLLAGAAAFAAEPPGPAAIDLGKGWLFHPAETLDQAAPDPASPDLDDSGWSKMDAGARWEDQGFPDLDGAGWYRKRVEVPAAWTGRSVWFYAGAFNDEGVVYCNGTLINTFGPEGDVRSAFTPVIADLGSAIRFGENNLIAVKVVDRGGSGGIWRLPCRITASLAGLPLEDLVFTYVDAQSGKLAVDWDLLPLGLSRPPLVLEADVTEKGKGTPVARGAAPASTESDVATLHLALPPGAASGTLRARLATEAGNSYAGLEVTRPLDNAPDWSWPGKYGGLKVLNNLVTELAAAKVEANADTPIHFLNPREGWVFIGATPLPASGGAIRGVLDGATNLVWRTNPETGAPEAMQSLAEGEHTLSVRTTAPVQVDVRAIPELDYCYYPATPQIRAFGDYDWGFVSKYVLSNVNTLITSGTPDPKIFEQWRREGRHWIANAGLPGLSDSEAPGAGTVYAAWAGNSGYTAPGYSGMIVDEFTWQSPAHYAAWTDAADRLQTDPAWAGRTFYAWCLDLFAHPPGAQFARHLRKHGGRFVWEKYEHECPTLSEAQRAIHRDITAPMRQWKSAMPGMEDRLTVCLGYLCAPPESLDLNPGWITTCLWTSNSRRSPMTPPSSGSAASWNTPRATRMRNTCASPTNCSGTMPLRASARPTRTTPISCPTWTTRTSPRG